MPRLRTVIEIEIDVASDTSMREAQALRDSLLRQLADADDRVEVVKATVIIRGTE